jgi:cytoplasmic iron level regulating protein YaaA (DUF328/UPF0246 family)
MLTILGPAKTIDMTPHGVTKKTTLPTLLKDSQILVDHLRKYSLNELKELMKVSDKLATLNFERYSMWKSNYDANEGNQALMSFSGEVFNGLQARSLNEDDLLFAQDHVRILSGLYGVLRPLDSILPYRLEMGTKMKNKRGRNLYEFWTDIIASEITSLAKNTEGQHLINLASNEYFSSISPKHFPYKIITPIFKEHDGNGFRNVTIYAKKARGLMLRFIIQNRIISPENLKAFDEDGYYFNPEKSTENEWWFCR